MTTTMTTDAPGSLTLAVVLAPLGVWLLMAVLAVANGVFRETLLIPRLGEYGGHVLSTAMLVTAILLVAGLYFTRGPYEYATV